MIIKFNTFSTYQEVIDNRTDLTHQCLSCHDTYHMKHTVHIDNLLTGGCCIAGNF